MLADTNDKPDVSERYETATNTSRLLMEEHRTGAADVLASAGMAQQFPAGSPRPAYSQLRTGMALLRLHSEWNAAAKPRRMGVDAVEAIVKRLQADDRAAEATAKRKDKPYTRPGAVAVRAQREADMWFASELRLLANGLKSRGAVWEQLSPWAAIKGHDPELVAEALLYWLSPVCRACDGLKLRRVEGQPALSARQCSKCSGTGTAAHPAGTARVLAYLDESVSRARQSIKKRLRPQE
jgi:hypothetical protein